MRIGEAIRLDRGDVDWGRGRVADPRVEVRQVAAGAAAAGDAGRAAALRPAARPAAPRTLRPSFFVSTRGNGCSTRRSRRCSDSSATAPESELARPSPPRLHDLRHTFAVRDAARLVSRRRGREARMPSLSTYLGHREPRSTYWYLSAAPELLALAAGRLETALAGERPDEPHRADPAGVLHRPARQAAAGQPAHDRGLPRHPAAAARVRAEPHRQGALRAGLGRPRCRR